MESPLTREKAAAFRLNRHHLVDQAPVNDLVSVADDMAGAQAQVLSAAQVSLWARVQDLQIADIEKAMDERRLVKASAMRRTLFLLPAGDLAVYMRGTAGRGEKGIRWTQGKGVPDLAIDAAIEAVLAALDEPRTRPEIAERTCRTLGVQVQTVEGGGGRSAPFHPRYARRSHRGHQRHRRGAIHACRRRQSDRAACQATRRRGAGLIQITRS
jgi:hypothetical protein